MSDADDQPRNVKDLLVEAKDASELMVDLAYSEDSRAEVDANFVLAGSGGIVEVQGTAEGRTFARDDLKRMLDAAWGAIQKIHAHQERAIAGAARAPGSRKAKPSRGARSVRSRSGSRRRTPAR